MTGRGAQHEKTVSSSSSSNRGEPQEKTPTTSHRPEASRPPANPKPSGASSRPASHQTPGTTPKNGDKASENQAPPKPRIGARDGGGATVRASTRTRGRAKKAPTGAGGRKFEWKDKTNDGTTYLAPRATDPGDPMYSSGNEDDDNYVLVSGDADNDSSSSMTNQKIEPPHKSVSYCAGAPKVVIGPKYALAEFKRRLNECLEELFLSGDVDEAVRCVIECECPEFAFEIVKRGVSKAMDRKARERELCSKFFAAAVHGISRHTTTTTGSSDSAASGRPAQTSSSSSGGILTTATSSTTTTTTTTTTNASGIIINNPTLKLLTARDVAKGFERLFEATEDLVLDAPLAPAIVSDFLVRCVVDEVLPPAYLVDRVFAALGGAMVDRARRALSRDHAGAKLERIWGPGDGRDAQDLKLLVDQLLGEFHAADDVAEAVACVRELQAPNFGHEVVKRAVVFFLPKSHEAQLRCSALLKALANNDVASPALSPTQARLGFERLHNALPDLKLDVPNAADLLDAFERRALEDGVLRGPLPSLREGSSSSEHPPPPPPPDAAGINDNDDTGAGGGGDAEANPPTSAAASSSSSSSS